MADRLVLPTLTPAGIAQIAAGTLAFDRRVRDYILASLSYRFVELADGPEAGRLEAALRRGEWAAGKPLLNPG